jgi:hypothetical protein
MTRLGLNEKRFEEVIGILERCGIATPSLGGHRINSIRMHLDIGSPAANVHRTLMRLKGIEVLQQKSDSDAYFLSTTFSTSDDTRARIKTRFLEVLQSIAKEVEDVEPTEVFHLNIDLFKV